MNVREAECVGWEGLNWLRITSFGDVETWEVQFKV
jgi:hypothetical protein